MNIEEHEPTMLWRYYQRGYTTMIRSGRFFRQVVRPALSHVYFLRAMPLLVEYARANQNEGDLPPGFTEQMEACPLSPRDLLHLDYAICLGYVETQGLDPHLLKSAPVLEWPGPSGFSGVFIAADALIPFQLPELDDEIETDEDDEDDDDDSSSPPFDL